MSMQSITIDIVSKKAMKVLHELASNQLIKMPSEKRIEVKASRSDTKKPSDYRGAISKESGKLLQDQIKRGRIEWE
jgi:hypothetical protein